jgi:hypothetical protein
MAVVEIQQDCGCFFEYEPDPSRPYHARWILCGRPECFRVQGQVDRSRLEAEIRIVEDRLQALKDERARRFPV